MAQSPLAPALEPAGNAGNPAPADLAITVRDMRFSRHGKPSRWWLNNDPVATAWYNCLSGTFPRGEAYFIDSVKAHREGVPPKLAEEIRRLRVVADIVMRLADGKQQR